MSKKSGIFTIIFGLVLAIGSLFFDFFDTGSLSFQGWASLTYFFQNIGPYFEILGNIVSVFQSDITMGVLMLFPMLFLPAVLFLLIGLKSRFFAFLGWLFMAIPTTVYLIMDVILELVNGTDFSIIFGYIGIGFYLQFAATVFLFIGFIVNKKE